MIKQNEKQWIIQDFIYVVDDESKIPRYVIQDEKQLREILTALAKRKPGIILLTSPETEYLEIGIGGKLATLRWTKPPVHKFNRMALAKRVLTFNDQTFFNQGINTEIDPKYLLDFETMVEGVVYFFNNHELPSWLSWREWVHSEKKWKMIRAKDFKAATTHSGDGS